MPLASTRPPWHAPVHDLIMLHMLSSVRSTRGSQEQTQLLLVICRRGMGSRAMGCVVWVTSKLTATCLAMRRRVRRESAFARSRPRTACEAHAGGGRCLRRSRAPQARRGRFQRVWEGCGVPCGRCGGGRVLGSGIYSHFTVGQFFSFFRPSSGATRRRRGFPWSPGVEAPPIRGCILGLV